MNRKKSKKKVLGLSRNVVSMGVVSFLNDLSSDMVFPFIPIFLTSILGASASFVGLVEGVADATASVLKIVSGRLSDKLHQRKPIVVFGYSFSAIAKPILAFALQPWHVLLVRFFDRVGKGTREAPRDALLSFSTNKKDVGKAFGFHRGADTLGAALGPLIAFAILPLIHNNLRTLFLLSFIASFFSVMVLIGFVKEKHRPMDDHPSQPFRFKFLGFRFTIFLIAATVFSLGKASEAFLLLRANAAGIVLGLLPILYFAYNITFALSAVPVGILSDKIGHRNTFMIGMALFAATYFMMAHLDSSSAMWFIFIAYGFCSAFTEGVGRAIVADLVKEEWRATAYGMYNAFTGIALLPASLVFGLLWDRFGPRIPFLYGTILALFALFLFLLLRWYNHGPKKNNDFLISLKS